MAVFVNQQFAVKSPAKKIVSKERQQGWARGEATLSQKDCANNAFLATGYLSQKKLVVKVGVAKVMETTHD